MRQRYIDLLKERLEYDEIGYIAPKELDLDESPRRPSIAFIKTKERGHDRFYCFFHGKYPECYKVVAYRDKLDYHELHDKEYDKITAKHFAAALMENML